MSMLSSVVHRSMVKSLATLKRVLPEFCLSTCFPMLLPMFVLCDLPWLRPRWRQGTLPAFFSMVVQTRLGTLSRPQPCVKSLVQHSIPCHAVCLAHNLVTRWLLLVRLILSVHC